MSFHKKLCILALCVCAQMGQAQEAVDLTIPQARNIGTQAVLAGDFNLALQIAQRLLQEDPNDRAALLIVAASAPRLGDAAAGRQAGQRAFQLSQTDAQKYEAARLIALAAANEERFTLATFWLRRALINAPNEAERERTLKDASAVRRANPWSTNLQFSLVPSNNVNGGATSDRLTTDGGSTLDLGLSRDAQALKGWTGSFDFNTSYRLHTSAKSQTAVSLRYRQSRVRITETDNAAEELDDDEFASGLVEFGVSHDRAYDFGTVGGRLTRGRVSFALEPYYDFSRLNLYTAFPVSDDTLMRVGVSRELQEFEAETLQDVDRNSIQFTLSQRLPRGDRLSGTLGYAVSDSDSVNSDKIDWTVQGSYDFAQPVGPFSLGFGAGVQLSNYDDYLVFGPVPGGREDTTLFYNARIGVPGIEYAGFTPVLTINGNRSKSNISRFTRNTFSAGFEIQSAF